MLITKPECIYTVKDAYSEVKGITTITSLYPKFILYINNK